VKLRQITSVLATAAISATFFMAPAANAEEETTPLGNNALTNVLNVAAFGFDTNPADFDILTNLVLDVMGTKPNSPVWALADGNVQLTAFIPTDRAFKKLVKALTGQSYARERKVYRVVRGLGMDTVEKVLLYHVVVGAPILSGAAVAANGASIPTAEGSTIKVVFDGTVLRLRDKDTKRVNPNVILPRVDINEGNNQVAHPINGVLLPKLG
jgi:uncharacterized surface protein with fasciclin (FAS1) repeats